MSITLPAPYMIVRDFLTGEQQETLLSWTLANESRFNLRSVLVDGVEAVHKNRLDGVGPLERVLASRLQNEYSDWIRQLRVSPFQLGGLEFRIGAYGDGAHFDFHLDIASGKDAPEGSRMLTGVYYYYREPKKFSGGDLRLFHLGAAPESDDYVSVPPEQNTLVVFPSWVGHSVTTIHCPGDDFGDSRFALNCWLHRRASAT